MPNEVPPRVVKKILFKMLMELNKILLDISMWNKCERIEYLEQNTSHDAWQEVYIQEGVYIW
jgi:hypothetical protein